MVALQNCDGTTVAISSLNPMKPGKKHRKALKTQQPNILTKRTHGLKISSLELFRYSQDPDEFSSGIWMMIGLGLRAYMV